MSVEGGNCKISKVSATDMSSLQYRVVEIDGTLGVSANTAVGIATTKVLSGEHFSAVYKGHAKGYAGGAVTAGNRLTVSSGGWLTVAASGTGRVGTALATATSGSLVEGVFDFTAAGTV